MNKKLPPNYAYGVDTNNPQAVADEYLRLKKKHERITILCIVLILLLLIPVYDFYRVYKQDAKPILAIKKEIEGGILYKGFGYNVLYCDDGNRYLSGSKDQCVTYEINNQKDILYTQMKTYFTSNKIVNDNFKDLVINSYMEDETNNKDGYDYYVEFEYTCSNGSYNCFKKFNDYIKDNNKLGLIVRLNRYNEIYDVVSFKTSGSHYNELVNNLTDEVKEYFKKNNLLDESNLRKLNVELVESRGSFKYNNVLYSDSYSAVITYDCNSGNDCLKDFGVNKESNYTYEVSILVKDNEVGYIGSKIILDL